MAEESLKEIEKLHPALRLKKLREIEDKRKKELKEAEGLIKKLKKEIDEKPPVEIEAPPLEPVDISKLFEKEATLEGEVKDAPSKSGEGGQKYEAAKYDGSGSTPGYSKKEEGTDEKMDDMKYQSVTDDNTKGNASQAADKQAKRYSRG